MWNYKRPWKEKMLDSAKSFNKQTNKDLQGEIKGNRKYDKPGTPRKVQKTAKTEQERLDELEHHTYRSGLGSLLYLLKHSKPDLSNPIRELSRCMASLIPDNRQEMHRIIQWVINKKNMDY